MPKRTRFTEIDLNLNIDDILAAVDNGLDDAMFEGGEVVLRAAEPNVPRRTGDMATSGYVSTAGRSTYKAAKTNVKEKKPSEPGNVAVGFADFKARWNEYGTVKMAARPFIRPALDSNKGAAAAAIVAKLRKELGT